MTLDVVRQVYQHFGQGDLDALVALFDEDIEWVVNGTSRLESRAVVGLEGVRNLLETIDKAWMLRFSAPREFIDAGDKIVVLGEGAGKERATGEPFQSRWAHVFTLRGDRIVSFRLFVCQFTGDEAPPAMSWQ